MSDINETATKSNQEVKKAAPKTKPATKKAELISLSSTLPTDAEARLTAIEEATGLNRSGAIRFLINLGMKQVINASGSLAIESDVLAIVPHCNMVQYCMVGVPEIK